MNYELLITKKRQLFLIILVFLLDRGSKYLVLKNFSEFVVFNQNGLFGILPWWVSILGFGAVFYFIFKEKKQDWEMIAILAAGLSNLFGRLRYNGVVDFIHVYNFPVFNLADAIISCGVGWLVWKEVRE